MLFEGLFLKKYLQRLFYLNEWRHRSALNLLINVHTEMIVFQEVCFLKTLHDIYCLLSVDYSLSKVTLKRETFPLWKLFNTLYAWDVYSVI